VKILGAILAGFGGLLLMGSISRGVLIATTQVQFESSDDMTGFIGAAGVALLMFIGGITLLQRKDHPSVSTERRHTTRKGKTAGADELADLSDIEARD
jgi:hypothetical protein